MFFVVRGFFSSWHTELGLCSETDISEPTAGVIHAMLETKTASVANEFQQTQTSAASQPPYTGPPNSPHHPACRPAVYRAGALYLRARCREVTAKSESPGGSGVPFRF